MTFDELNINKPLLNALDDLGYRNPTPIQKEAYSPILSGADIVGVAQTGTGKTFAYLLPLLRLWKYNRDVHPRIAILVPTRELVVQIVSEIEKLSKYLSLNAFGVYGGTNINTQKTAIYNGLDIIVGTPGRLMDLSMSGALKLKSVKHFIIDEVDEMFELGFRTQLENILDMLPKKRQNLLFSATLSPEVETIVNTFFKRVKKIEIAKTGTPLEQIDQSLYQVPNFYTKINLLTHLLEENEDMTKVLVFIRNKRLADKAFDILTESNEENTDIGIIHSNKSQNKRLKAVESFKEGDIRVLIATDVIARGVDITEVSHVINFDMPEIPEIYIHRIGRTGRADKNGIAISFITEDETELLSRIEELMKKSISKIEKPTEVIVSEELLEEEKTILVGDKHYRKEHKLKNSGGAFHKKTDKNLKENRKGPKESYHAARKKRRKQRVSSRKKK